MVRKCVARASLVTGGLTRSCLYLSAREKKKKSGNKEGKSRRKSRGASRACITPQCYSIKRGMEGGPDKGRVVVKLSDRCLAT